MRLVILIAAMAALGACASMDREESYGAKLADAKVQVDGRNFSIWVHPTDQALLIQRGFGAAMGQAVAQGLTMNAMNPQEPKPVWRRAAEQITGPLGCTLTDVYSLDNRMTWEATFTCPAGTDLRASVMAQRSELRAGKAIQP